MSDLIERVARALERSLAWDVEQDVYAGELTHEERVKVAQAAIAAIEADRAELVADVFAYLIARSQEPEEFLPGSYVKRLHADERTAWLKKMQKEYNEGNA